MPDILLTTFNARYSHASFGLRYLMANLGPLSNRAEMLEFDIHRPPREIVETLLARDPTLIGIGVYIWNVTLATEVVRRLKALQPGLTIILGGPEVSYEIDRQEITQRADYTIAGEGERVLPELCARLLAGQRPENRVFFAEPPDPTTLTLPYALYTDQDIAHRHLYVETSRGCPFKCEYCLSALDRKIRWFPLDRVFSEFEILMARGARHFKFVDRTFNIDIARCEQVLRFFLDRMRPDMFLHLEMVPDRFPDSLRELIQQFPPATLQLEIGVQTLNEDVALRIARPQRADEVMDHLRFLRDETGVHMHVDLIAGLPGESLESFATGFDRLVDVDPHEIQVGILKHLRGALIERHDQEWQMVYNSQPPYEIVRNQLLDDATVQRVRRFARFWDVVANSGNFVETRPALLAVHPSPFWSFMEFSDWLYEQEGRTFGIPLKNLADRIFQFLVDCKKLDPEETAAHLWNDYREGGRSDRPDFALKYIGHKSESDPDRPLRTGLKRQVRHLRKKM